jgi:hypothetical protein
MAIGFDVRVYAYLLCNIQLEIINKKLKVYISWIRNKNQAGPHSYKEKQNRLFIYKNLKQILLTKQIENSLILNRKTPFTICFLINN